MRFEGVRANCLHAPLYELRRLELTRQIIVRLMVRRPQPARS